MTTRNFLLLTIVSLFFLSSSVNAAVYNTTQDGDWDDPSVWDCLCAPPSITSGGGDTYNIDHNVTMKSMIFVQTTDVIRINASGTLTGTSPIANKFFNESDGIGQTGGVHVYGILEVTSLLSLPNAGFYVHPSGRVNVPSGAFDNQGDLYVSGVVELTNSHFFHNAFDIWIDSGGNMIINNGNFYNRSSIRNLFPNSCIRILGGSFFNEVGGELGGNGGVTASGDVDNSANPMSVWSGVTWCAGGSGINVAPALEECGGPCSGALEVELLSFDANLQPDGTVKVEWITGSEDGSATFTVERSTDLQNFETVETILAAGNSDSKTTYEITDNFNGNGLVYYRLHETDIEGKKTYSDVRTVFMSSEPLEFEVYPNPATDHVKILVDQEDIDKSQVRVFDLQGMEILRQDVTMDNQRIDLSNYPKGMYIVTLVKGSQFKQQKILVQ